MPTAPSGVSISYEPSRVPGVSGIGVSYLEDADSADLELKEARLKTGRLFVLLLAIVAQGCASRFVAYEGPARPKSQIAVVRLDPSSDRLKFGSVDDVALPKSVHEVRVLPGIHLIGLRGFSEQGAPLGITVLAPLVASLSVDAQAGHFYVVKATGTNIGQVRFNPWIEDQATGEVVAGKKSYGARY